MNTARRAAAGLSADEGRWEQHRGHALAVRAVAIVVPVAASVAMTYAARSVVPQPGGALGAAAWWAGLLALATVTWVVVERGARRLLPLAALMNLSLVFPDRAPPRYRLALRQGTVGDLDERLHQARVRGERADTAGAAEALLELVDDLNAHDRGTRGHAERTRALADLIAEEGKLAGADRDKLHWSALLHDIGKLAVPSAVLNKTEPLTAEEWDTIRRHPEEGARLVAPLVGWLGDWSRAVGEHHEWWDGTGYPNGLAGEEISMSARIVAVAEAFDAMTSVQSYRERMTPSEARAEITQGAGTQFDPGVVRAFLNISLGRLRKAMGPITWLSNLPIIARTALPTPASLVAGAAAVGTLAFAGLAVAGSGTGDPPPPPTVAQPFESVGDDEPAVSPPSPTTTTTTSTTTVPAPATRSPTPPAPAPNAPSFTRFLAEDTSTELELAAGSDSASIVNAPGTGVIADLGGGRFRYAPPHDFNGTTSLLYQVCSPAGACASGVVTLTVTPVDDAPDAKPDTAATNEDQPVNIAVRTNDTDPEGNPLSIVSLTQPAQGSTVKLANGTIRFTPAPDKHADQVFAYTISDGAGGTDTATVTVAVASVNDPPSFTAGPPEAVLEDAGPQTVPGWATAISPGPANESAQTVGFNIVANDNPALFGTPPAVDPTGRLTYTTAPDANGVANIGVEAQDDGGVANGGNDTSPLQLLVITIGAANDPPELDPIGPQSVEESQLLTFTATATDPDVGDALTLTLEDGPGSVPPGAAIDPDTGDFTWTPTAAQIGTWDFDVVVTDDGVGTLEDRETITVTVASAVPPAGLPAGAAGTAHSCFALADGTVWCTGLNPLGQLGTNTVLPSVVPLQVVGPGGIGNLTGVTGLGAGDDHTCAVRSDATAWCWGDGLNGELGDGLAGVSFVPVQVVGPGGVGFLTGVKSIEAGTKHTCAVKTDGTVWCWGDNNRGQLGDDSGNDSLTPVQVLGLGGTGTLTGITSIGSAFEHTCAVKSADGTVYCWGAGGDGQIGHGTSSSVVPYPEQVVGVGGVGVLTGIGDVSGGEHHTCATEASGSRHAFCWGDNGRGQLGDGSSGSDSDTPVQVLGPGAVGVLTGATDIGGGKFWKCVALDDGTAYCWGEDTNGQLGDGLPQANSDTPVQVVGPGGVGTLTGVLTMFEGGGNEKHSCAGLTDGTVWCWGNGVNGQLGDGTATSYPYPVRGI